MTAAQRSTLDAFNQAIADVSWFEHCGEPNETMIVAADLAEAHDSWGSRNLDVWLQESKGLERVAIAALTEDDLDEIFESVSTSASARLRIAMERYYERRPDDYESAQIGADRGLWPEWLEAVQRDLCWAAVEAVLDRPGFFSKLLEIYRDGRWPCATENGDGFGRVVVL